MPRMDRQQTPAALDSWTVRNVGAGVNGSRITVLAEGSYS